MHISKIPIELSHDNPSLSYNHCINSNIHFAFDSFSSEFLVLLGMAAYYYFLFNKVESKPQTSCYFTQASFQDGCSK